ncbi:TPA: SH3 domain-containing protein [Vibrio vulnificus]|uniref:SH3 domain-containing protein n=1 Tax=Vibrio vulnificus TaxID=672 RepID=UPI000D46D519|nr:SH3 domain-containing protein [Vibrio vulnificus]EHZ7341161.1 SH3 domain-containing protein [Vibrio vulnificus]ELK8326123.1 SH3 domain-containing protein [Vibrio vulnificus]ELN6894851.1 SH3 domain-containing protein [Vibrio vulnificus]ELV8812000.1 SH3 domain-containing protein [Vibrio vulnificus]MCA3984448.1 SH3 domain-containing protein [Vibrio vulnificus]
MKKIMIILIVVLLLIGGGAGYYVFFMQPGDEENVETVEEPIVPEKPQPIMELPAPEPEITDYYVIERRIDVRNKPEPQALIIDALYKGEKITILEKQNGWGRISDYLVYEEGGEERAEWVDMIKLSDAKPVIEEMERLEILDGYLVKSDDLKEHRDVYRKYTQMLLNDGTCKPEDFEELGGWVRSVTFQNRDVYFIYCGGLAQENKIYLDVQTGEIFYR